MRQSRHFALPLLVAAATLALDVEAQAPAPIVAVAGCYAVVRGPWTPPIMEDSIFYRIPPLVRLDTTARGRRGRTLSPDIDYPHPSRFPGTPLWTVERDTLFLLWSNGFTPTRVHAPLGVGPLRGVAIAMSDAMNAAPLPSATIRLDRVPCPPP